MRVRVLDVTPLEGYKLRLRFQDGAEGIVDIAALMPLDGVFAPLRDRLFFEQVRVDRESGAVTWPGNLDLDPYTLYVEATGKELHLNNGAVVRPSAVTSQR